MLTTQVLYLLIGALAAMAVLPWRRVETSVFIHWVSWVFMWPAFLLFGVWVGLIEYRSAWWRYRDRCEAYARQIAYEAEHPEDWAVFRHYTAGKAVRDTYFKKKKRGPQ